jgi:hypothetical protein
MRIFTLSLWLLSSVLLSCASKEKPVGPIDFSKTFQAPYEMVWRATQQALLNYPMNINNMDTGQLQTLYITGKHRYIPPHEGNKTLPSGYQYRININIIKGEKRSRVTLSKEVRMQRDFFTPPEELVSDGYEEKMLLYRIRRELIIERILQRQMEKQKATTS